MAHRLVIQLEWTFLPLATEDHCLCDGHVGALLLTRHRILEPECAASWRLESWRGKAATAARGRHGFCLASPLQNPHMSEAFRAVLLAMEMMVDVAQERAEGRDGWVLIRDALRAWRSQVGVGRGRAERARKYRKAATQSVRTGPRQQRQPVVPASWVQFRVHIDLLYPEERRFEMQQLIETRLIAVRRFFVDDDDDDDDDDEGGLGGPPAHGSPEGDGGSGDDGGGLDAASQMDSDLAAAAALDALHACTPLVGTNPTAPNAEATTT
eukprot:COSAG04_NODE_5324_length_1656_cov_2.008992_2_plen_268_part_00